MSKIFIIKVESEYGTPTKEQIKENIERYDNIFVDVYETNEVGIVVNDK